MFKEEIVRVIVSFYLNSINILVTFIITYKARYKKYTPRFFINNVKNLVLNYGAVTCSIRIEILV